MSFLKRRGEKRKTIYNKKTENPRLQKLALTKGKYQARDPVSRLPSGEAIKTGFAVVCSEGGRQATKTKFSE